MVMDVYKVEQISCKEVTEETETTRPPLAPSEKNIVVPRRPKTTREVSSRYKAASSCPATPIVSRRCPSPNVARPIPATTSLFTKRAQSAERRRPSTPSSSPRPTTPLHDATPETQTHSKRLPGGRTSEGLWPSGTMRSLCVSFQSDTFSLPITKKEKPINHQSSLDHTLKTSANGVHRQAEATHAQRKMTPERRTTPLRGRNASDQLENSKPLDNSHVRAIDQHRWPSRTGSKVSTSPSIRSGNLTDKASKTFSSPLTGRGVSPLRRLPVSDVMGRGLQKAQSEVANRLSFDESGGVEHGLFTGDALRSFGIHKFSPPNVKSQSLPIPGSRPPSPSRTHMLSSSPARGSLSPSRARPSSPFPSASSVTSQSNSSSSVLSFIADYRKGKKGANHIEDAHQLRLLYNRYLQWRYANARADVTLSHQRIIAEKTLYNVWNTTSELWGSVTKKRINLQQLRQETKLTSTLNEQVAYLEDWALLESGHSSSLTDAIKSLEACTLRLPITTGAKVDIQSLKGAVCSAADVMQAMGSSIGSLLSRVEETNCLVSELADVTAQERAMVYDCVNLLSSTEAMQVEENSLRTHLMQLKQALRKGEQSTPIILTPA